MADGSEEYLSESSWGDGILAMLQASDIAGARSLHRQFLLMPISDPQFRLQIGLELQRQKMYEEAISSCAQLTSYAPDNDWYHFRLGMAFDDSGQFDRAIAEYQTAISIKSDDPNWRLNLGTLFQRKGELTSAIREFRKAIEIDPDFYPAWGSLTEALELSGELPENGQAYQTQDLADFFCRHNDIADDFTPEKRCEVEELYEFRHEIIRHLYSAFDNDSPNPDDEAVLDVAFGASLAVELAGKKWREVPPPMLHSYCTSLSFLRGQVFQYYLPAILIACLHSEYSAMLETTTFIFVPPSCQSKNGDDGFAWREFRGRFYGLSTAKYQCIKMYIKYAQSEANLFKMEEYECILRYWDNPYFP